MLVVMAWPNSRRLWGGSDDAALHGGQRGHWRVGVGDGVAVLAGVGVDPAAGAGQAAGGEDAVHRDAAALQGGADVTPSSPLPDVAGPCGTGGHRPVHQVALDEVKAVGDRSEPPRPCLPSVV